MTAEKKDSLLEEYRQLCEYHRHEDIIKWTILGLGYTASGALVSFAIDDDNSKTVAFVLFALSTLAVDAVTAIYFDVDRDTRKRLRRLHKIERRLGMVNHRLFQHPKLKKTSFEFSVNRIIRVVEFWYGLAIGVLILRIYYR